MSEPTARNDRPSSRDASQPGRSNRTLVLVMLGIIILSIVAFLVLRPDPSGTGHTTTHTNSQPSPSTGP